ncbi:MAG: sulfotransferase [Kiritimatiellae bacterium]|nr:sulfotransferase [Kiritimatiellia bacterium]MDD5522706.1 sulfotransferase [Kiritimatiellia bacterium]
MRNKKVLVINGMSRGGTNILSNMIQSHPAVCSARHEASRLFSPFLIGRLRFITDNVLTHPLLLKQPFTKLAGYLIDKRLYAYKMRNFEDDYDRFKADGVAYTREEIAGSAVCLRAMNETIFATELFRRIYGENAYFIGIIRNGYGICESWKRRGVHPEKTGHFYRKYVEAMYKYSQQYPHYMIVKFEDVLSQPFEKISEMFCFAELEPKSVEKIRLKAKTVLTKKGTQEVPYGDRSVKYWLDRDTIRSFLVVDISDTQKKMLTDFDLLEFEREAMPALKLAGYA